MRIRTVALALHYRMASEQSAATVALEVLSGEEVTEANGTGRNKADAFAHLSRYAPGVLPIHSGGEQTDESAFRHLAGTGITVLVTETPRLMSASFYIKSPARPFEVLRFLIHGSQP